MCDNHVTSVIFHYNNFEVYGAFLTTLKPYSQRISFSNFFKYIGWKDSFILFLYIGSAATLLPSHWQCVCHLWWVCIVDVYLCPPLFLSFVLIISTFSYSWSCSGRICGMSSLTISATPRVGFCLSGRSRTVLFRSNGAQMYLWHTHYIHPILF